MSRIAVPKTFWRSNSIVSKYGAAAAGVQPHGTQYLPSKVMDTVARPRILDEESPIPDALDEVGIKKAQDAYRRQLGVAHGHLVKLQKQGVPFLDVRDISEMHRVPCPNSIPLHIHDLQSGAAAPILPLDKSAKIVVVGVTGGDALKGTASQRSVNAFNALRHMGYNNVTLAEAIAAIGPKAFQH